MKYLLLAIFVRFIVKEYIKYFFKCVRSYLDFQTLVTSFFFIEYIKIPTHYTY